MKDIVKVSDFYHPCKEIDKYKKLFTENNRYDILQQMIPDICSQLKNKVPYSTILSNIQKMLENSYQETWFPLDWQYAQSIKDDVFLFQRFFSWLDNAKIIDANIPVIAETDGAKLLMTTSLITLESDGRYTAINLFLSKNKKSMYGKSIHTAAMTDLYAMTAKLFFEEAYPGIRIRNIHLKNDADSPGKMLPTFVCSNKRESNIMTLTFEDYYTDDGIFEKVYFEETINNVLKNPTNRCCYNCYYQTYCKQQQAKRNIAMPEGNQKLKEYQLPAFTPTQEKVIHHVDGPMLVCAGPGSGKTAVLVGRMHYLMTELSIPSEYLLAVTFTDDAARELRERCASFCEPDDVPKVVTLNALGYEILRKYSERKIKVLTKLEQMHILDALVQDSPPICGFNYEALYGKMGLLSTLARKIEKYMAMPKEQFLKTERLGEDFFLFADRYRNILLREGYITFDEQISLCIKLFQAHPEILHLLKNRFRYIAVDEYQDINSTQDEFISLLVGDRGNLVAVGDDDQSIYGFRGGSNSFMINFSQKYPLAKVVVLRENFRSTKAIVTAAETVISQNKKRIQKEIISVNGEGMEPVLISEISQNSIERTIENCIRDGYSYDDIAVLAFKNVTLETLANQVTFPVQLGKNFLVDDVLFHLAKNVLEFCYERSDASFFYLKNNFHLSRDKDFYLSTMQSNTPLSKEEKCFLSICQRVFSKNPPALFLSALSDSTHFEGTASEEALSVLIGERHIRTTEDLYKLLTAMVRYGDDTRISKDHTGSVIFITSHESKGLEFPVVLLIDDFNNLDDEEMNRLYYVALTRAKERFYLLQDKNSVLKGGFHEH